MEQRQLPLIDAIAEFTARVGMSAVTFGRKAMNDPHFVRDLHAGRRLWPETEAKVRDFMAGYSAEPEAEAA